MTWSGNWTRPPEICCRHVGEASNPRSGYWIGKQANTSQLAKPLHQRILKPRITHLRRRLPLLSMVPIPAVHLRGSVIARRQPRLREMPHLQIVGRAGAAHFGRHPAGIDGVAEDIRPVAGEGGGEGGDVEFAFRIGLAGVPWPAFPVDIVKAAGAAAVHAAGEIDQAVGASDPGGEEIGGEHVDRERFGVAFGRFGPATLEVDAGIVDDGVHAAESVDLFGDRARLGGAGEIADDEAEGGGALAGAGVEDDVMALADEGVGGGKPEAIGGTGDEDAAHGVSLLRAAWWGQSAWLWVLGSSPRRTEGGGGS